MIIEYGDRLLQSSHVVHWDTGRTGEGDEQTHTVSAHTVLDTVVEVFRGTESECEAVRDKIKRELGEEHMMLRHLCEGLAHRDDRLAKSIVRLTHGIQRL